MKVVKLNQRGVSHLLIPTLVIAVVALVGIRILTASHADQIALMTTTTPSIGSNVAWEGPLSSSASNTQVVQSSVPYTIMGYQKVVVLAPGQAISYINGIKGNVQTCYDVYVQQPKAGTATASISIATNNNVSSRTLSSTTSYNLRRLCVNPGTGSNPGYSIKNTTSAQQNTNIEVLDEQLRW